MANKWHRLNASYITYRGGALHKEAPYFINKTVKYAKEYFTMKIKGQETPSPERFVNT